MPKDTYKGDICTLCIHGKTLKRLNKLKSLTRDNVAIYNDKKHNLEQKFTSCISNAKGRCSWNLTFDECAKYFIDDCFYCGHVALEGLTLNGIDRVDSSKGYCLENCVACCGMCNRMKNNFYNAT